MNRRKSIKILILSLSLIFALSCFFGFNSIKNSNVKADDLTINLQGYYYFDFNDIETHFDGTHGFISIDGLHMYNLYLLNLNTTEGTDFYYKKISYNVTYNQLVFYNQGDVATTFDLNDSETNDLFDNPFMYYVYFDTNYDNLVNNPYFIEFFQEENTNQEVVTNYYTFNNSYNMFDIDIDGFYVELAESYQAYEDYFGTERGMDSWFDVPLYSTFINGLKIDNETYYETTYLRFNYEDEALEIKFINSDEPINVTDAEDLARGSFQIYLTHQSLPTFIAEYLDDNGTFTTEPIQYEFKEYGIKDLFYAITSVPVTYLSSFLSFEIFGMNMFVIVCSLITLVMAIWVVKKFI